MLTVPTVPFHSRRAVHSAARAGTTGRRRAQPGPMRIHRRRLTTWHRAAAAAAAIVALATGPLPAGAAPAAYRAPLAVVEVVQGFDAGASAYGPGHRGVDLRAEAGTAVAAAADGVVSFAGPVADRGVVVILHGDGIRTTYEPVAPGVRAGDRVTRGQPIGVVAGAHHGRADVLHWGARRGEMYLDPLALLLRLGPVRLIPTR